MYDRAIHGIHTGQQSAIFRFLFPPEENHDINPLSRI